MPVFLFIHSFVYLFTCSSIFFILSWLHPQVPVSQVRRSNIHAHRFRVVFSQLTISSDFMIFFFSHCTRAVAGLSKRSTVTARGDCTVKGEPVSSRWEGSNQQHWGAPPLKVWFVDCSFLLKLFMLQISKLWLAGKPALYFCETHDPRLCGPLLFKDSEKRKWYCLTRKNYITFKFSASPNILSLLLCGVCVCLCGVWYVVVVACTCVHTWCVSGNTCHSSHLEVKGQLYTLSPLLPPLHEFWGSNLGPQSMRRVPLPTEPSCQPSNEALLEQGHSDILSPVNFCYNSSAK